MEETISLQELFSVLKKRIGLIIISMFLGVGIAGVLTFFVITPKYSSQAQLMVRLPQSESVDVNNINANLQMINTYKDLIKSDTVMGEVKKKMKSEYNNELTIDTLKASIEVTQSQNSQMFSIITKGESPIMMQNIANLTALVFQEKAQETLSVDKISIISSATANLSPVSPNNKLNLLIGLVLGMITGIAFAFVLELFDKTIKSDSFVSEELGFTLLGIVPNMSTKELSAKIVRSKPANDNADTLNLKSDSEDATLSRRTRPKV